MKVGVIDIGTLKVKLLISDFKKSGELNTIYESNTLTGLGIKISENGGKPYKNRLNATIEELKRCQKILQKESVKRFKAVSTHALREMGDIGKEVVRIIQKEVGMDIEIINQQEEATLFFNAVLKDFPGNKKFTLIDVGGGSVQILIGTKDKLDNSFLLKTGTSTLWDKFTLNHTALDYPRRGEIRKMKNYILEQIQPIPKNLKTPIIYGSSCIIDFFKGIKLPMQNSKLSPSHPYRAKVADIETFLDKFWTIPYDKREVLYISPTYKYMWGADKALLNILELAKKVGAPYVIPTNSNINKGLVLSLLK